MILALSEDCALPRPRCRFEDNSKMDIKETGLGDLWTGFIWLRIGTDRELL
jgi:hypothetical protein